MDLVEDITHCGEENVSPSDGISSVNICTICSKIFKYSKSLRRHVRMCHPAEFEVLFPEKQYKFFCSFCHYRFNKKTHLVHHERTEHTETTVIMKPRLCLCPVCSVTIDKSEYICHIEDVHNVKVNIVALEFDLREDFVAWKEMEEKRTNTNFIKSTGMKLAHIEYYACHRSGEFISRAKGCRHLKIQGSVKMDGNCPARLKVTSQDGKFVVSYTKTHFGHSLDIAHMRLTEGERMSIATKIAMKISSDSILDEIRDSVSESGLERIHLLTRQDLKNIECAYSLQSSAVRHTEDGTSVEAWVNEMNEQENSSVLFYKPQGSISSHQTTFKEEDFVLIIMNAAQSELLQKYGSDCICIDETHGLNPYEFKLITVMVLDDLRQGFPCAFFISNRSDQNALAYFFFCIKQKIGKLHPQVFMSDMAEEFFNAWVQEMDSPGSRLFCTWHVDQAWRRNLKKIRSREKQLETYKLLITILQEMDRDKCDEMIPKAMRRLQNDPETIEFANYFSSTYLKNVPSWAFSYRVRSGLNTNMHLESMHGTLKQIYLDGKTVRRLDKGIHAIMRMVKDKLFDRIITMFKGKVSTKLKELRKRHRDSQLLSLDSVVEVEGGWTVKSSRARNVVYSVRENKIGCVCRLKCTECMSCFHQYTCSCIDSSIKWNMCKHIHLVCTNRQISSTEITAPMDFQHSQEAETLINEVKRKKSECVPVSQEEKEDIKKKFIELINSASTNEDYQILASAYNKLKPTLNAVRTLKEIGNVPMIKSSTSKYIPQRRLFSTKRKRKESLFSITKPTTVESQDITDSLFD